MVAQSRDRETDHGQSRDGPNRENAYNINSVHSHSLNSIRDKHRQIVNINSCSVSYNLCRSTVPTGYKTYGQCDILAQIQFYYSTAKKRFLNWWQYKHYAHLVPRLTPVINHQEMHFNNSLIIPLPTSSIDGELQRIRSNVWLARLTRSWPRNLGHDLERPLLLSETIKHRMSNLNGRDRFANPGISGLSLLNPGIESSQILLQQAIAGLVIGKIATTRTTRYIGWTAQCTIVRLP